VKKDKDLIIDFTIEELDERIESILIKPLGNDPNCTGCGGGCEACCYVPPCHIPSLPPCQSNPGCPNVGIITQGHAH
jgi:hypothetical protein